ncbi:MAG: helix-turn-helix domain-containing protein [Pseudomonadota bacterium]
MASGTTAQLAPRRTQEERRNEAENALLDAAAQLITEKGIHGASLSEIGRLAGYSRGLVNHHFGTKDALLSRLIERSMRRYQRGIAREKGENGLETLLARARWYVDAYLQRTIEHPALLVMWGTALASDTDGTPVAAADSVARGLMEDALKLGQTDGSISTDIDLEASAYVLVGMLRGIAAMNMIKPDNLDVDRIRSAVLKSVRIALQA